MKDKAEGVGECTHEWNHVYGPNPVRCLKCGEPKPWKDTSPTPQPEGSVEALLTLASNWQKEHDILNGPGDHRHDRIAGRVYGDCAQQLRAVIDKMEGK